MLYDTEKVVHRIEVFQSDGNDLLQIGFSVSSTHLNCTMDKINYNRIKVILAEKNVLFKEFEKYLDKTESTV